MHDRPEPHGPNHLGLHIDAGSDFDEFDALGYESEHGPLRDVEHLLPLLPRGLGAERHLIHTLHKLGDTAFLRDAELAAFDSDTQAAGRERAAEDEPPGGLRDVDEAADAGEALCRIARR